MRVQASRWLLVVCALAVQSSKEPIGAQELVQEPNTWVKRSPLPQGPPSPRLGYEGACVYDRKHQVLIRYGGHNQGGGGEQGSEVWIYDPRTSRWQLMLPNCSPPGVCCAQQNVYDPVLGRYIRFPAFSGNHGWQWFREIYLNNSSVWSYDLARNLWTNHRPLPAPRVHPLRCASWDEEFEVVVLFGGEGSREGTLIYDPYTNQWTRMNPPEQPPFRSAGNMAYDVRHRVHVLFGAQFSDDPYTWVYSVRQNRWERRRPEPSPPANRNDAVLCYDESSGKMVAVIKVTTGHREQARHRLETWLYDVGANRWEKANPPQEPDPTGNRARGILYAPDLKLVLLENCTRRVGNRPREQQIWTYRSPAQLHESNRLDPPSGLRLKTTAEREVVISWDRVPAGAAAVEVLGGQGTKPWLAKLRPLARLEVQARSFRHRMQARRGIAFYRVRCVDRQGRPGRASGLLRAQPRAVERLAVSVLSPSRVLLQWEPPPGGQDVVGYLVQRASVAVYSNQQLKRIQEQTPPMEWPAVGAIRAVGQFETITAEPVTETRFLDTSVDLGQVVREVDQPVFQSRFGPPHLVPEGKPYPWGVYAYRVVAINALGVLSGPSPAVLTIPSPVQYVFSREEGQKCLLKWEPNPEQRLQGYLVFRMDGRFRGSLVRPLTSRPLTQTQFEDPQAGRVTRRYYVVAVDALGQQGHPSSPVWFRRQWQRFYEPFVGPWHQ